MSRPRLQLAALFAACVAVVLVAPALGLSAVEQAVLLAGIFALAFLVRAGAPSPEAEAGRAAPRRSGEALPVGFGRALLNRMPAPLIVISGERLLTYANPAAQQLLPKSRPGAHFSTMIRTPAFVDAIERVLAERAELQFSFAMPGQQERVFEARASFLPAGSVDEFGQSDQVVVLIEDRTRDKALLEMRSDFIANASHELRTPLASILGYIETLQGHAKDDPEARERFLGIMQAQAMRMRRLVDDLMSLSRIEMDAHVRPEERIDLFGIAADAAAGLYPQASQHDVILQIELPRGPGNPRVLGDRDQIAQVMANLVDNAVKYSGSGQKVRVCAAEPDSRYPGCLGISVIDDGPGIAREHIPRLTERFYRVNASKSKKLGGTGLGLAITKHILQRHGGALDIRSRLGEGSRFTIWVPEAPDAVTMPDDSGKSYSGQDVKVS